MGGIAFGVGYVSPPARQCGRQPRRASPLGRVEPIRAEAIVINDTSLTPIDAAILARTNSGDASREAKLAHQFTDVTPRPSRSSVSRLAWISMGAEFLLSFSRVHKSVRFLWFRQSRAEPKSPSSFVRVLGGLGLGAR